jgi:hypothetical protein
MTQPAVGQTVQYFTHQTREKGQNRGPHGPKLDKPIPIGPCAAIITEVRPDGRLNLVVWMPNGHMYPAFGVTTEPTTPVLHMWRPVPRDAQRVLEDGALIHRTIERFGVPAPVSVAESKAKLDALLASPIGGDVTGPYPEPPNAELAAEDDTDG